MRREPAKTAGWSGTGLEVSGGVLDTRFPDLDADLVRRLDRPGPRYTSYPTVPVWTEAFGPADHGRALELAGERDEPLSLYVHIPFCQELCSYCGCNVVVSKNPQRLDAYVDTVAREAQLVAARLGKRRRLSRVHYGGGTPTSLDERQLERLWKGLTAAFSIEPGAELAIEIDPCVTRPSQLTALAQMGFNRLSVGVQDFDPDVQNAVSRIQSFAETEAIISHARSVGFRSVNTDLIYGLPMQTPETWRRTLELVLRLAPDRLATFSFAFVPDVRPNQRRLPVAGIPSGMDRLALLRLSHEVLGRAGYRAIGLDHFARPTDELSIALEEGRLWRDFQGYTTRRAPETVALGSSGISDVGGAFVQSDKRVGAWTRAIESGTLPTERGYWLTEDDVERRAIITDLMCNQQVDLGREAEVRFGAELSQLRDQEREGLVTLEGPRVTVTPLGRVFLRNVAMVFDAHLPSAPRQQFSRTV